LSTNALVTAIWRRDKPDTLLHHSDRGKRRLPLNIRGSSDPFDKERSKLRF
jgi:hypothetical protein